MCLEKGVFPQKGKTGKRSEDRWTKQKSYIQSNGEASSEVSNRRQKLGVLQLQGFLSYYYPAFKDKVVVVFANEKDSKLVKICFEELNLKILMFIKMLNSTIVGIEPIGQNFEHKIQCL